MNKCYILLLTVGASWSGPSILFLSPFRTEYNEYCRYQIPCFITSSRAVKTNCYVIPLHKPLLPLIKLLLCQQYLDARQVYITVNNRFDAYNLIIFAVFKPKCTNKFKLCCLRSNSPIQSWSFADSCHQPFPLMHCNLYADNFILSALLALVSRRAVCARL